jgi:outer membrane protein
MMRIKKILLLLFSVIICFAGMAQDSLSIEQAITIGLKNNFQIRISEKNIDIAANNNSWGRSGAYPTISISAFGSLNHSNDVSYAPSSLGDVNTQQIYLAQPSVELNWILFNGLRIVTTKAQLEDLQMQTEGYAAITVENTLQSILLAYYLAKLNDEALKVTEEVLKLSRDRFKYVETQKSFGSVGTFDVLLAKSNYLTDSANVLRQRLNFENSVRNLNLILAAPAENTYTLSSEFDLDGRAQDFQLAELASKMESSNKTLQNQYIYQEILKKNIKLDQSKLYPVLSMYLGVNTNNTGIYYNGNSYSWNDSYDVNGRLALSWTLSNGGNIRRAIQNSKIEEEIGQIQTEEMRRALYNQLFRTYEEYNIKRQLRQVSQLSVESAGLNLQMAGEKFKSGAINSFNYRDIQIIYLNAARELLQSNFNLVDTYTELLRLTGGIVTELGE